MRPIDEVLRVLEWALEQHAESVRVDDVEVCWSETSTADARTQAAEWAARTAAEGGAIPFRPRSSGSGRPLGESGMLAGIAAQRAEEESKLGLPEFRTEAEVLAAEEAAEKGEQPAPRNATQGEE